MLPINLLLAKHRHPATYQFQVVLKRTLTTLGIGILLILTIIVTPLFIPILLLDWAGNKFTRCRKCSRLGGLRMFHPVRDGGTFYLCTRCKARYTGYGKQWRDASAPEYDRYFGKQSNVRSLLRSATQPEKSKAELMRPSLSTISDTASEQLVRPAGEPE